MQPQYTVAVSIFFSIIPKQPQYTIVALLFILHHLFRFDLVTMDEMLPLDPACRFRVCVFGVAQFRGGGGGVGFLKFQAVGPLI